MPTNKYKLGDILVRIDWHGDSVEEFTYLVVEVTHEEYKILTSYAKEEKTEIDIWSRSVIENNARFRRLGEDDYV